jgi:hypothetical protein
MVQMVDHSGNDVLHQRVQESDQHHFGQTVSDQRAAGLQVGVAEDQLLGEMALRVTRQQ